MAKVNYCADCDLGRRGDDACPLCEHQLRLDALEIDLQEKERYHIIASWHVEEVEIAMNRLAILGWTTISVQGGRGKVLTAIAENPHYDRDAHNTARDAYNAQLDTMDAIRTAHESNARGLALFVKRLRQSLSERPYERP